MSPLRGALALGAALAALAFGAPAASALPVTINGTPGNDEIVVTALTQNSGSYSVNGVPTLFAGATSVDIRAGDGDDKVVIDNGTLTLLVPTIGGTFSPLLGIRVQGGAGIDTFEDALGSAAQGWFDHDPAVDGPGTKTIVHIGGGVQKVVLDGVDGQIRDWVKDDTWTYRGHTGADNIGFVDWGIPNSRPLGYQAITNDGGEYVLPLSKGVSVIDTKTGNDVITLGGYYAIPDLVIDDGSAPAEDTVLFNDYSHFLARSQGALSTLRVRAAVFRGSGTFYGWALAVDAPRVELDGGVLNTATRYVEMQTGSDVRIRDADDVQVGDVWDKTTGVRSTGGPVWIETPGKLTVAPLEDVVGSDVTLTANALDLVGGAQARSGAVAVRPLAPGLPIDLGGVQDPAGKLTVGDAELDRMAASRVEIGRSDSGHVAVTAPFDRPTTTLALTSGAGYVGTSTALLGADTLELADGSAAGRNWTVDRSELRSGASRIPYRAGRKLQLRGGAGADTFGVKANPDADIEVVGGDPAVAPGDTLTYDAEGRSVSGDSSAPDGSIASAGVKPVTFRELESVGVVGAAPPPTPVGDIVIEGTPGSDSIELIANSPIAGEYKVNGQTTPFAAANRITVNAGAGNDNVKVTNPTGALLAPVDGIRVNGGDGTDSFTDSGGLSVDGTYQREAAGPGTAALSHTGALPQRIALESIASVTDMVGGGGTGATTTTFTYRGTDGPDSVSVLEQMFGDRHSYIQDPDTKIQSYAQTEIIDTAGDGSTGDVVTLTGAYPIAQKLVVDDGSASTTDVVKLDHYSPLYYRGFNEYTEELVIRAGRVEAVGGLVARTVSVEADHIDPMGLRTDRLEARTDGDIDFSGRVSAIGGLSTLGGVESANGSVSIESSGYSLNVVAGERIAGSAVTLEGDGLTLDGSISAPGGTVTLRPRDFSVDKPPVDLGSTTDYPLYAVSDAEFDRIDAASIRVGAPDTPGFTVSAPITLPDSTSLTVESGSGFTGTGAGALDAGNLTFVDATATGRAWSVTPSGVQVGSGAAIPFGTPDTVSVQAGGGDDTFAVKASPLVAYSLNGGAGSDSLTYDAEGRTTSGSTSPPDGSIESPGVRPVAFGAIEAVTITP
jgi:hypothetical protein